jgi:hypothetical protein
MPLFNYVENYKTCVESILEIKCFNVCLKRLFKTFFSDKYIASYYSRHAQKCVWIFAL